MAPTRNLPPVTRRRGRWIDEWHPEVVVQRALAGLCAAVPG